MNSKFRKLPLTGSFLLLSILFFSNGCDKDPASSSSGTEFFVSKTKLYFNPNMVFSQIKLSFNPINSKLNWSATYPVWIEMSEDNGSNLGNPIYLDINVVGNYRNSNYLEGKIVFTCTNGQSKEVKVIYSQTPISVSEMKVSRDTFSFNSTKSQYTFKIYNTGDTNINWTISNQKAYLNYNPSSGSLNKGDSFKVILTYNKNSFPSGVDFESDSSLLESNLGDKIYIKYSINNFEDKKYNLNIHITDAVFNKATNEILAIDNFNNKLHKINPFTQSINSISLPISPTCIAFDNNDKVAIGANGKVLVYNFNAMSLDKTISITKDAFDIVYGINNWIYVTPNSDQWEKVVCINPSTMTVSEHTGNSIYEGMYAVAHPTKSRFYISDTRVSPTDIERMDIANGTANSDGDSPYHGDYPINGELYISEDGKHIVSGSGRIFTSNDNLSNDMLYAGTFSNAGMSWSMMYSAITHNLSTTKFYGALVESGSSFSSPKYTSKIYQYSDDFFSMTKSYNLTKFVNSTSGTASLDNPYAFKIFCKADGSKLIVCTKNATTGTPKYAIELIDP